MRNLLFIILTICITSCASVNTKLKSAYNITKCEYSYNSIDNVTLGGINFTNGVSMADLPKAMALLNSAKTNLPLKFTVNLNVHNPNTSEAAFAGMGYSLQVDNTQLINGKTNQAVNIAPGADTKLPITVNLNASELLTSDTGNAMLRIIKNIIGMGNGSSTIRMTLRPSFKIGERIVDSPIEVPLDFTIGK